MSINKDNARWREKRPLFTEKSDRPETPHNYSSAFLWIPVIYPRTVFFYHCLVVVIYLRHMLQDPTMSFIHLWASVDLPSPFVGTDFIQLKSSDSTPLQLHWDSILLLLRSRDQFTGVIIRWWVIFLFIYKFINVISIIIIGNLFPMVQSYRGRKILTAR